MDIKRFSSVLGEDYNFFNIAVPHHDEFQRKVGEIIHEYCSRLSREKMVAIEGGVGTGISTLKILEADPRIHIIGIDNEEKTLDQAKTILSDYQERLTFVHEDLLEALRNMPDASANIFVSVWTIHNLTPEYRGELFQEVARVLKKEGLFINADKYAQDDLQAHQEDLIKQTSAFDIFRKRGREDLAVKWTKHYEEDDEIRITEEEQEHILEDLGFTAITLAYREGMEAIFKAIR